MDDMTKLKTLSSAVDLLPFRLMTPFERRAGRFMRAPDHDAATGGDAGGGDAAAADTAAEGGESQTASEDAGTGGNAGDQGESQSADAADDDGTVLGGKDDADADAGDDGEGDKGGDDAPTVPEAYELTAPEGFDMDADVLAEATPIFKELGLSNEQAQTLMPVAGQLVTRTVDRMQQQLIDGANAQRKAWLDTAKADPDIGGANWDASIAASARALDALGFKEGSDFRKVLNETGFGNHPDMIRAFAQVGKMVGEDGDFVRPDAGVRVKVPLEKQLYPND